MPEPKNWSGNLVIRTDQPRLASIAILPGFPAERVRQIRFVFEDNFGCLTGSIRSTPPCSGECGKPRTSLLSQRSISPLRTCRNISEAPSSIGNISSRLQSLTIAQAFKANSICSSRFSFRRGVVFKQANEPTMKETGSDSKLGLSWSGR